MERSRGFTLIELLVVLAVFGLLSVILTDGFRFAGRVVGIGMIQLDHAADVALIANFVRARLADTRPLPTDDGIVSFDGRSDGINFIGTTPAYLAQGGLQRESIAAEIHDGKRDLVFRSAPNRPPSILAEGITSSNFAYFGRLQPDQIPSWHERWTGASGLPNLIRLRMIFADGLAAPDLVVAVRPAEAAFR